MADPIPNAEPTWITSAWHNALEEVRLYVATFVGFILAPGRFAHEWAEGRRHALNPIAFVATGASVLGILSQLLFQAMGIDRGLLGEVFWALAPYAYYALLGAAAHLLIRPPTRRLSTSLGVALYAGGGGATLAMGGMLLPLVVFSLTGHPLPHGNALMALTHGYRLVVRVLALGGFAFFLGELTLAMHSMHQTRWRVAVIAVAGAVLLVGVLVTFVPLPTLRLAFVWPKGSLLPVPSLLF